MLMRPFLSDVAAADFCGAVPGRSQELLPRFHQKLADALVPIPEMAPGDMVFWHPDLIHAVQVGAPQLCAFCAEALIVTVCFWRLGYPTGSASRRRGQLSVLHPGA